MKKTTMFPVLSRTFTLGLILMGPAALLSSPAQAQTAYYNNLISGLSSRYGLPASGSYLIGGDEGVVMGKGGAYSPTGTVSATFGQALNDSSVTFTLGAVVTEAASGSTQFPRHDYQDQVFFRPTSSINYSSGDHLLVVFWVRGSSFQDNNAGAVSVGIQDDSPPPNQSLNLGSRIVTVTGTWKEYFFYVTAPYSASHPRVTFAPAYEHQTVQIGGVALIDYGGNSSGLAALNNNGYNYDTYVGKGSADAGTYDGDIAKNRKANVAVTVKDSSNNPVSGATVQFRQKKHAFLWGGDEAWYYLLDPSAVPAPPDRQKRILDVNFDGNPIDSWTAVVDQSITSTEEAAGWTDGNYTNLDAAIAWYNSHGVAVFLHTLAWGDATSIPADSYKNTASIRTHIDNLTRHLKGKVYGYTVLNETYNRTAWESQLAPNASPGGDMASRDAWVTEVAQWFKIAHTNDPGAKLYISDNDILEGTGLNENRIEFYLNLIAALQAKGAQVDGFAIQSHFGNDGDNYFDDIPNVKSIIDRFGALGVKVRISEFDFFDYSSDAQRAQYTSDFVNLCFSDPNVDSFTFWDSGPGISDGNGNFLGVWTKDPYGISSGFLYKDNSNYVFNGSGQAWDNLVFGKYWTDDTKPAYSTGTHTGNAHSGAGLTNSSGNAVGSVFKGDYDILVTANGTTTTYSQTGITGDTSLSLNLNGTVGGGGSAPAAPTGLSASGGTGQVSLSWSAPGGTVTGYSLYRATSPGGEGGTAYQTGLTGTSYTDTSVTNGVTYYYTVAAVNSVGAGPQSSEASATPATSTNGPSVILTSPTSGQNPPAGSFITFQASAQPVSGQGIDHVSYYRSGTLIGSSSYGPTFDVGWSNAPAGTYALTAVATQWNGATATSAPVTLTVGGGGGSVPAAPTGLTATPGNGQVALSWGAASGATSYSLFRSTSAGGEGGTAYRAGVTGTAYTDTGVTNGTTYHYTVAAVNAVGIGPQSGEASATPVGLVVNIISPTSAQSITARSFVTLQASAQAVSGQGIDHVSYYSNGTLIGTSAYGPTYDVGWTATAGSDKLTAVATQWNGATATSPLIAVTVH